MTEVVTIADRKKRDEIEHRYQRSVKAFRDQLDVGYRLQRAECDLKCAVAKSVRDNELRVLDLVEDWPTWAS